MKKIEKDDFKNHINDIAKGLDAYISTSDCKYIEEIESHLGEIFDAQDVKLVTYDAMHDMLGFLNATKESQVLPLELSLSKQAIEQKTLMIDNHIISSKYYNQIIDNPFHLKIKSLCIYPILKENRVIGIIQVSRELKSTKHFSRRDQSHFDRLSLLYLHILESKSIDKELLLVLLNEENDTVKRVPKKQTYKSNVKNTPKKLETDSLSKAQEEIKKLKKELLESREDFEKMQEKYTTLKKSSSKVRSISKTIKYMEEIERLNENTESVELKNAQLKKELEEKIKENKKSQQEFSKSMMKIESEKLEYIKENEKKNKFLIENVLQTVQHQFITSTHSYILLEVLLYAIESQKGIELLEDGIAKSKIVPQIIEEYYFHRNLKLDSEKNRIEDFIECIKKYEKTVFNSTITLNITVGEKVPTSLVYDASKMQSIILHLLVDLYQFVNHSHPIELNIDFNDKLLTIEMGGKIHQKNSFFKSIFKQNDFNDDGKERLGLQFSKKLISFLKGSINHEYEDKYYKCIVTLPTPLIKL